MKSLAIGLIARADNRGLGNQTWEFYRHMHPVKTLVIDMKNLTPYQQHFVRYPDARVAPWIGGRELPVTDLKWLVEGVDVIYTAETPYDYRLYEMARMRGVSTVLHINPEFYRYNADQTIPRPSKMIAPTTWLLERIGNIQVLPFPVARDRLPFKLRTKAEVFLHVAGHQASNDRAGTRMILEAIRYITEPITLLIRTQSPIGWGISSSWPRHVKIELIQEDTENYWDLYSLGDVLLHPRRYGGLSLPLQEALSCGMPVIALDREPENQLLPPESLVPAEVRHRARMQIGMVDIYQTNPQLLAAIINRFASDPSLVERLSRDANVVAQSLSWDTLKPRYLECLSTT